MENAEYPSPSPCVFHTSGGPSAGHDLSSPVSVEMPLRSMPRHCGQSVASNGRASRRNQDFIWLLYPRHVHNHYDRPCIQTCVRIVYLRPCIQTCVHNSLGFRARSNGAVTVRERFSEPQWISPCVSKRVGVSHGPERQPPSFSGDFIRTTCILQSQVIKIFIIFSAPITYWQTPTPAPLFF
jgi:hypothetical protein